MNFNQIHFNKFFTCRFFVFPIRKMNLQVKSPVVFCFAISTIEVFQITASLKKFLRMSLLGSWEPGTGSPNNLFISWENPVPGFQLPGKDTFTSHVPFFQGKEMKIG